MASNTYKVTVEKDAYFLGKKSGDTFVGEFTDEEVKAYKDRGAASFKKGSFKEEEAKAK